MSEPLSLKFQSTKTWGNEVGLSCAFRQWRATHSHCQYLHGYALGVRIIFEADRLDERNWVFDFGDAKWIKEYLQEIFDHKTVVAADDPELDVFKKLAERGLIQLRVIENVGCEQFAAHILEHLQERVKLRTHGRVRIKSVEVFEHGANSAIVETKA